MPGRFVLFSTCAFAGLPESANTAKAITKIAAQAVVGDNRFINVISSSCCKICLGPAKSDAMALLFMGRDTGVKPRCDDAEGEVVLSGNVNCFSKWGRYEYRSLRPVHRD